MTYDNTDPWADPAAQDLIASIEHRLVTAVCTAPSCEDWYFRGPADEGFDAADMHELGHGDDVKLMAGPAGAVTVIEDIPGESDRERRGRIVREVWVQAAHERGETKPSHLTPWPELNAVDRALDERIGAALAADDRARQAEADCSGEPAEFEAEG